MEVLSESTEAFDRGDKFHDYQSLESLEEYVLINSHQQRVEIFKRQPQGGWIFQAYTLAETSFPLQSLEMSTTFIDLYEDVDLEPESETQPQVHA